MTWIFCSTTGFFFFCIASIKARRLYLFGDFAELSSTYRRKLLYLNVSTMLAYATTFLAISRIDPYSNSLIDYGATPILSATLAVVARREYIAPLGKIGMALAVAGIVVLTSGLAQDSKVTGLTSGVLLALTSCCFASWNNVLNKDLVAAGMQRENLVASRMPLPVLVLGAYVIGTGFPRSAPWLQLVAIGIVGVAVPLYLVVYAFKSLDVRHLAVAFFLIPVAIFLMSLAAGTTAMNLTTAAAGAVILVGVYVAERADRVKVTNQRDVAAASS